MLSNAYFLAKFCFDTAENEPAKNLQKIIQKLQNLPILPILLLLRTPETAAGPRPGPPLRARRHRRPGRREGQEDAAGAVELGTQMHNNEY